MLVGRIILNLLFTSFFPDWHGCIVGYDWRWSWKLYPSLWRSCCSVGLLTPTKCKHFRRRSTKRTTNKMCPKYLYHSGWVGWNQAGFECIYHQTTNKPECSSWPAKCDVLPAWTVWDTIFPQLTRRNCKCARADVDFVTGFLMIQMYMTCATSWWQNSTYPFHLRFTRLVQVSEREDQLII